MSISTNPEASRPELSPGDPSARRRLPRRADGATLQVGVAVLWLSLIVLLPLAAIVATSAEGGWSAFWSAVSSPTGRAK